MLSNAISLSVDSDLDGTAETTLDYARYSEETNKTVYVRSDHQINDRHEMALFRRLPVRSGNYNGNYKLTLKFTDEDTVAGVDGTDIVAPIIFSVEASIPVGVTAAAIAELRGRVAAALADSDLTNMFTKAEI